MSNQNSDRGGGGGGSRNIFQEGRCPAGTHISSAKEPPKVFNIGGMNGLPPPFTEACLTDLAQAAEQARSEERKARKRHMDAIYARRRRVREKVEETELQQDAQHIREMNQKLREENKELEALLTDAKNKIEGMEDADTEWLQSLEAREASRIEESRAEVKTSDWQPKSSSDEKQNHVKPAKLPKDPLKASNDGSKRKPMGASKVGEAPVRSAVTEDHSSSRTEGGRNHTSLERQMAPPARLEGPNLGLLGGSAAGSMLNASSDSAIQAILHQSYLQGLNDAARLSQQQLQRDSALISAAAHQRELDQLLSSLHAASRRNPMPAGGDYSSLLAAANALPPQHRHDPASQLYNMAAAANRLAAPTATGAEAFNFHNPTETALTAVALQNLQKLQTAPPSSSSAAALAYATQGVANPLQLQMQLGILAAYERMFPPWPDPNKRPPDEG